jgi:hypothetical protein
MHDMPHYNINCYTQYLYHNCITYAQQFTDISTYKLIPTAEII